MRQEKQRYCKFCGGTIDADTKKCTKCYKQYFNPMTFKKSVLIFLACVIIIGLTAFGILHFAANQTRNEDYLYDWLTEHGTLVEGTCLKYSEITSKGDRFSLCYDTNRTENRRWYVTYETEHILGYTIKTELILFWDNEKAPVYITVSGCDSFADYYRSMEYSHRPAVFTKNSPIERGEISGSMIHVPDSDKELVRQILDMSAICENNASKNLCLILDWLKDSFCPTAKMSMSNFGYNNY